MRVQVYTKPGCPLCEDAIDLLDEAKGRMSLVWDEVNIYDTPELFERYRYRVPVIRVGDSDVLELKFTLDDLVKALS